MNLIKFNPKRLFQFKKRRSAQEQEVSRSDPPSFGSGTSPSSSSSPSSSVHKPLAGGFGTPTSVLPNAASGDWSEISAAVNFEIVQAFKLIDRDNDGMISREDLEALLYRICSEPPTAAEVVLMLNEVDSDGNGLISLDALTARVLSACGPACDSELRDTFDFFDSDHDGKITAEELHSVFVAIGDEGCTLDDCQRMIADVDENGDGFVCFAEFVRMMELH